MVKQKLSYDEAQPPNTKPMKRRHFHIKAFFKRVLFQYPQFTCKQLFFDVTNLRLFCRRVNQIFYQHLLVFEETPCGPKTAWFSLNLLLKISDVQNIGIWRMIQIPHDEDEPPKPTQK